MKLSISNQLKFFILSIFLVASGAVNAQTSFDNGFRDFNNRNYIQSAQTFQSIVKADPNHELANYYLGQAYIKLDRLADAENVYAQALKNPKFAKSGLLMAGKGHVTLLKGDSMNARLTFDEAQTLSRTKTSDLLNAIGVANLEKGGNVDYAIDVLNQVSEIKKLTNSRPYVTLGYLYKKKKDGSRAVQSLNTATRMNPREAEAYYQIGKIFATQDNEEVFLANYHSAIKADPEFYPTYFELYSFYFNKKQVDSATKYLTLYDKNLKDPSLKPMVELFHAELLFLQKKYTESIAKVSAIPVDQSTKTGRLVQIRAHRLKALSLNQQGKYNEAFDESRKYLNQLEASGEDLEYADMFLYIRLLTKADEARRNEFFTYAVTRVLEIRRDDPVVNNHLLAQIVEICDKEQYPQGTAKAKITKLSVLQKGVTDKDYFDAGYAAFNANMYREADSIFRIYVQKQPNEPYGYFWVGSTNLKIDTATYEVSKPFFEKYISLVKDKVADNKQGLIKAYTFIALNYTKNKNYDKALENWNQVLAIDPQNKTALQVKAQLDDYKKKMDDYKKRKDEYDRQQGLK